MKKAKNRETKRQRALREARAFDAAINAKRQMTERHLRMTIEDWRLKKRQEWKAVMSGIDRFMYGCAYTPAGNDFYELQRSAHRIKEAMDEDWVCW